MLRRSQRASPFLGLETELGFYGTTASGTPARLEDLLAELEASASRHFRHVCDGSRSGGIFLENGGRFYRDGGGGHLELCTPEVDHPDALVEQALAGERLMLRLAELSQGSDRCKEIQLSGANHSYQTENSWGHHENYSGRAQADDMLPFLATRFLLDGSGGFVNRSPGIEFTISPRIHFITASTGRDTQSNRTLHNLKCEALGTQPRTHVITGDGVRSPSSLWLRFACTALVVALSDLGISFPSSTQLVDPVSAAHAFALDPTGATKQETLEGARTAAEIQKIYLETAAAHLRRLPAWAQQACERWADVLQTLERRGPKALAGRLDWCAKKTILFDRHVEKAGWNWEEIARWNRALRRLAAQARRERIGDILRNPGSSHDFQLADLLRHSDMRARLAREGLDPERADAFATLRESLRALDLRYMLLGEGSLYELLQSLDLLEKPPVDAGLPTGPEALPRPASGRAKLRALLVTKHGVTAETAGPERRRYAATWTKFFDRKEERVVDMSDLRNAKLEWQRRERPSRKPSAGPTPTLRPRPTHRLALRLQRASTVANAALTGEVELETGLRALNCEPLPENLAEALRPLARSYWRDLARLHARLQHLDETFHALSFLASVENNRFALLCEESNLRNTLTLRTHPTAKRAVKDVERFLANRTPAAAPLALWRACTATALNRTGQPEKARALAEANLTGEFHDSLPVDHQVHTHLALADSLRLSGRESDWQHAMQHTMEALCKLDQSPGRLALKPAALLQSARVRSRLGDSAQALADVREALEMQLAQSCPSAIRSYFLLARLNRNASSGDRTSLRHLAELIIANCSALRTCPHVGTILSQWDQWCSDAGEPDPPGVADPLWGV